jgi:predicted regulator of Ras-like GTPase activity (Roadblock/LC7/MglB family)
MPTIRDLVRAIAEREGVDGVIVLGRDGLLIDARTTRDLDGEHLAAHVPSLAAAADTLGEAAGRGALVAGVVEFERGLAVVSALGADALLLVALKPGADAGALLLDLRRHRASIASIV